MIAVVLFLIGLVLLALFALLAIFTLFSRDWGLKNPTNAYLCIGLFFLGAIAARYLGF